MATAFQIWKLTSTLSRHRCNWQRSYPTASLIKESPKLLNVAETWKWKAIKPMCSLCCRLSPKNETQRPKTDNTSPKKINVLNALLDSQMLVNKPVVEECVEVIDRNSLKNKTEPSHCQKPIENVNLPVTNRRTRITTSKSFPSMYVTLRSRRCVLYKQNHSVASQIIPERDPIKASDPCKPKNDPCKMPKDDPCKPRPKPCKPDPCPPPKKDDPCADPCAPKKDPCPAPNPCPRPCPKSC